MWLKGYTYDFTGIATWARHNNNLLNQNHDIYGQMRNVHDTTTDLDEVTLGYSAGGLRTMKWFYHWVDTCGPGGGPLGPMAMGGGFPPPPPCNPFFQFDFTYYIRGQNGQVLAEYADLDGSPTARYIYAGSQRIAMVDSLDNVYYYLNCSAPQILVRFG